MGHYKAAAKITTPPKIIVGWLNLALNDYLQLATLGTFYIDPNEVPIFEPGPATSQREAGRESPFVVIMFDDRGSLWRARHADAVSYLRKHGFLKEGEPL